ncbi:hypothetical protein LWI28_019558 [Acer negundo]|uniref:SKP1-like protein n=1 Tax=Acer negundo TaxID=4023 RepID=A0AAD5IG99_ACENE|nr:hypothetical protein LWI28_019558 [Acer negundo]
MSTPSVSVNRVLKLKSSDGEIFEVKQTVAVQSGVLKQMMEDGCTEGEIPLNNVDSPTLAKIIEWCNKHHDNDVEGRVLSEEREKEKEKEKAADMKKWESEFIDALNRDEIYFLLTGSNYMDIKELLDCAAQKVADMVKGKTPEAIREMFNIQSDFTEEEEEAIRKENQWAFD